MSERKKTPLYPVYGDEAKLIPFAGWEMPVQFSGIKKEHQAVRNQAGLFDVSHMGEIEVSGLEAVDLLQKLTTNDVSKLEVGRAQYTFMCYPDGGTIDDFVIYQIGQGTYRLVVNAANTDKVLRWIQEHNQEEVEVTNLSSEIAQLAIQGPNAEKILQKLTDTDLSRISFFHFLDSVDLDGIQALVSRSGYTGEDGFELYFSDEKGADLWKKLLRAGEEHGLIPCGLGARDTLRFEACLPLYGQELSEDISPVEAGLGFAVKALEKTFIGSDILKQQLTEGPPRKLVGLEMVERGIPRSGYSVWANEEKIGFVTSGTQSPTLKKNLGLALILSPYAQLGDEVQVEIRGKKVKAKIVKKPFYRRK